MITYIIAGLFIVLIATLLISGDYKLKLMVKSADTKEVYTAEKKTNTNGNAFLDWFYYDQEGNQIEDENLKQMIFEAFSNEDWYGDYEFYAKSAPKKTSKKQEPA